MVQIKFSPTLHPKKCTVKSACIQTSRPHPGKTADLDATFYRPLAELVL